MPPTESQTDAFYRTALLGLAWLDAKESAPRRFGPAADATWRNYAGQPSTLTEVDRIELLLRDAATLHPDAFGPRAVFALDGLTDDEPFGQWLHAPASTIARDALRSPPPVYNGARALLDAAAKEWGIALGAAAPLPAIGPTTRVLCAGAGALAALAEHFERDRSLAFQEQVVVLAGGPAVRQLVGLATLTLGERSAPRVVDVSLGTDAWKGGGTRLDAVVISDDASDEERAVAEAATSTLGR